MDDVGIAKAAGNMGNSVCFANVSQKLVAQPFTLGRAFDEACDIDESHVSWDQLVGRDVFLDLRHARIRHFHDARIRIDRTERIVGRFGLSRGQRIKDCRFTDVWKSNNTASYAHRLGLAFSVEYSTRKIAAPLFLGRLLKQAPNLSKGCD